MVENVRQSDEKQWRTWVRLDSVCKAGRDYDKSRNDSHGSVKNDNVHRLAYKSAVLFQIASEYLHCAYAYA